MRLAVFTAAFPGPINTFFARDMAALIRAGIEVDVFPLAPYNPALWSAVPDCLGADVLPRHRVHHVRPLDALRPRASRAPVRRYLADTLRVRASALRFGPETVAKSEYVFLKAWTWARDHATTDTGARYDHVLAYWGNYAATAAYLFHRLTDRDDVTPFSIVLHAHDLYSREVFLPRKLLHADNVIVVCDFNRRYLQTRYPDLFPRIADNVHLHHLGLDVDAIVPNFDGRRPRTCLAVGRLDPSKGFDDVLRAAAVVRRRGIEMEVVMVGEGEQGRELRRLAASLGIADRVDFRGWLPFDAVPAVMREATVLVHPSCGLGDAVPTVIKEAMALGTPVIGSTAVGIPELLDHGRAGLLVPERHVERLADAMVRLLTDAGLRDRTARAGRAFAERTFHQWRNGDRLAALLRATRRHTAARAAAGAAATAQTERRASPAASGAPAASGTDRTAGASATGVSAVRDSATAPAVAHAAATAQAEGNTGPADRASAVTAVSAVRDGATAPAVARAAATAQAEGNTGPTADRASAAAGAGLQAASGDATGVAAMRDSVAVAAAGGLDAAGRWSSGAGEQPAVGAGRGGEMAARGVR